MWVGTTGNKIHIAIGDLISFKDNGKFHERVVSGFELYPASLADGLIDEEWALMPEVNFCGLARWAVDPNTIRWVRAPIPRHGPSGEDIMLAYNRAKPEGPRRTKR